ncbi:MAG: SBBP repeat-containing protein, partial [Promethearchaeota archaeon]
WDKSFGTAFPEWDIGWDITIDSDNNLYITGHVSVTSNGDDVSIIKFDKDGNQIWNRTWGGNGDDCGYGIALDSNINVYITGETFVPYKQAETFLLKYNKDGVFQWSEIISGSNYYDICYDVAVDTYDDIYITGYNHTDLVLYKYDNQSNQIWNRTWSGSSTFSGGSGITIDSNNKIYITGSNNTNGDSDLILLRYNIQGDLQMVRSWDGNLNEDVGGVDIATDSNDFIYILGNIDGQNTTLSKYNDKGQQQWVELYPKKKREYIGRGININKLTNNIYITGYTYKTHNPIFIVKYNSSSDLKWETLWDGSSIIDESFPEPPSGDGNDNGDNSHDNNLSIPFGNFVILFTIFAIISLVIVLRIKSKKYLIKRDSM